MKGWKKEFEQQLKDNYPGVSVYWSGNAPTLVIPDDLEQQKTEIAMFAEILGRVCGVVIDFSHAVAGA